MTGCVFAQGTTSRVLGTVQDPSGAAVAGATVHLTNDETNAAFTTTTADNGAYFFEAIQVGKYSLKVDAKGFRSYVSKGNQVSIGTPATINASLEIGAVTESVIVEATVEVVQTSTSGNYGNVFSEQVIKDLPIVGTRGRNPLDLVNRQPGVVSGANTGGGVHVNGARDRAWNFTIDGIDSNETSAGGSNFSPVRMNPDSLAEFKVLTGNATAEYGRNSGGQVAMATKSGTNEIHGSLFWFYRTPSLNANEWEYNIDNLQKRQFVQNIPGFSAGGPIKKNKLFYYVNTQWLYARDSGSITQTVYTKEMREGLYRYNKAGRNLPYNVPGSIVDASGNVLPGAQVGTYSIIANDPEQKGWDSRVKGLVGNTPLPNNFNTGDGLNTGGFTFAALQYERQYDFTTKVDYILNERNTVFGRVSIGQQNTNCDRGNGGNPFFPGQDCIENTMRNPKNMAFNWRTNPKPTITNEFVFGLNMFAFDFQQPGASIDGMTLTGPVTVPQTFDFGNKRSLRTWQFVDNFAWVKGEHNIKFGTNIRLGGHTDTRGSIGGYNSASNVNFSRTINTVDAQRFNLPADVNQQFDRATLESHINFVLGRVGAINRGFVADGDKFVTGLYNYEARYPEYDFYVQDTWKVRKNLTLDLGLRWEIKGSQQDPSGRMRHPNQPVAAGAPASSTLSWVAGDLYRTDWNNLGPSVGFAWDPFSSGKTSIRGNYRIAYDRINTFVLSSSVFQNLPGIVDGREDQSYGQAGGRLPNLPNLQPPVRKPADLTQPDAFGLRTITVVDPNFQTPTTQQWGLSLQRQIFKNTLLEANYIGRRAYHLFGAYNNNQTFVRNNGFQDGAAVVAAGGDSPLINQLMGPDSRRRPTETGSEAMRRLYPTELRNYNVGALSGDLSRRSVGTKSLADAAGLGPYFFLPYPQFASSINVIDSNDFSTYNALQVQVEKRFSAGLTVQAGYTWAKSLDTRSFDPAFTVVATANSQSAGGTPFDIYNRKLNYGLSDFDRTHVFQSYWLYELPFGKGKKFGSGVGTWTNRLIGGWQVSGFMTISSGRPFTPYSGFNTYNSVVQSMPNCSGCSRSDGEVYDGPGGVIWYLPQDVISKMSYPTWGDMGNTGRNFFRGPGSFGMDASFLKRTTITERVNLEIRADMTNFTNTPTFGFPTATESSATFGRIRNTVVSGSRKIQLGAKINF